MIAAQSGCEGQDSVVQQMQGGELAGKGQNFWLPPILAIIGGTHGNEVRLHRASRANDRQQLTVFVRRDGCFLPGRDDIGSHLKHRNGGCDKRPDFPYPTAVVALQQHNLVARFFPHVSWHE